MADHDDPAFLIARSGLDPKGIAASISSCFGPLAAQAWSKPAAA